jgi:ubiquitin C-terminal hydrolase
MLLVLLYFAALACAAAYALAQLKAMQGLQDLLRENPTALALGLGWLSPGRALPQTKSKASDVQSGSNSIVPGLQNLGGNACFLNSSLQAMASLPSVMPFLKSVHDLSESTDTRAPVTHALLHLFTELNAASTSQRTLRPVGVVNALYETCPRRSSAILNSDQQDAQEFFLLLLAAVLEELQKMEKVVHEQALAEVGLHSMDRARSPVSDPALDFIC